MIPEPASYPRHRFPAEIISHAVWLYHVFSLSLRDVELILAERGVVVTHESIRHWCLKFGADFASGYVGADRSLAARGTWTRCSSGSEVCCTTYGGRWTSMVSCSTSSCRIGKRHSRQAFLQAPAAGSEIQAATPDHRRAAW